VCPRVLRWPPVGTCPGAKARLLKAAGAATWVPLWGGFREMVCRLGGCLSVAEIPPTGQEPEGLELTITGATGRVAQLLVLKLFRDSPACPSQTCPPKDPFRILCYGSRSGTCSHPGSRKFPKVLWAVPLV
ncbi:mCG145918, partial [Mus musculus]